MMNWNPFEQLTNQRQLPSSQLYQPAHSSSDMTLQFRRQKPFQGLHRLTIYLPLPFSFELTEAMQRPLRESRKDTLDCEPTA